MWEEYDAVCKKEILLSQEQEEIDCFTGKSEKSGNCQQSCFLISPIIRKALRKQKIQNKKQIRLQNCGRKLPKVFHSAQESFRKQKNDKQKQMPVWEQQAKNLLEALKLAEERDIQRQLFDTRKRL